MKFRALSITWLLMLGLLTPFAASAHPHNWIDLQVEVRFDSDGRATGLHQQWLFDDYYSVFITEGMDGDGDGKPDLPRLEELRKTVFSNLVEHKFFTHVEQQGGNVPCGPVSQGTIRMRGHRVEMEFFIPFESPRDPRLAPLSYRIFDPSFFIEMLHNDEIKDAVVLRDAPGSCRHRIEPPNPDPEKVAYAASLPIDADGGNELGRFFAEKVTIQCPAAP
jgi:ABC-type uncharacterized transport system substrate-binding protein